MSDFSQKVSLGRTGLRVSRIGIGSSYGVSEKACREAFDAGINYFFWGSARTAGMCLAIREIALTHREELVVVLQCYVRWPMLISRSVHQGLKSLKIDHADVLLLGWYDEEPSQGVMDAAEELRREGRFRYLGISGHQRPLFRHYIGDGRYDVLHLRYNAAHRGAEQDIFPHLPRDNSPGIVSFTNTRWGDLLRAENMPAGYSPPAAADCYRFVLSDPHVHVAICGPKNAEEIKSALTALDRGPMDQQELQRMRLIGDHVHGISSIMSLLT